MMVRIISRRKEYKRPDSVHAISIFVVFRPLCFRECVRLRLGPLEDICYGY